MPAATLPASALSKTALHAAHEKLGAKMGEFAGYDMPLYYAAGVVGEHTWTRSHAGLFDVSHMGQILLEGAGATAFLERLTPSNFIALKPNVAKYTVLMTPQGGIIDDLIVTKLGEQKYYAVINAGCKEKDLAWIRKNLPADVQLTVLLDRALIALQGPDAEAVLRDALGIDASDLSYMRMAMRDIYYISRLGYTGEDGFEISVPVPLAEQTWNKILQDERVKPVGLAARDTLRLEMQYCLYGHEIDENTSPLEADLGWVMRKDAFPCFGAQRLEAERSNGVAKSRVALKLLDKGVAREGAEIADANGAVIGILTSGGFSPTLQASIGMGYVPPAMAKDGQQVGIKVRDRVLNAVIVRGALVPARTKSAVKPA